MRHLKAIVFWLRSLLLIPHVLIFLSSRNKSILEADIIRWVKIQDDIIIKSRIDVVFHFLKNMICVEEFRNVYYFRIKFGRLFNFFAKQSPTLFIRTSEIGGGLFIQHGFSTIIVARKIGKDCWINQQVTIGFSGKNKYPTIGNNVNIKAGAKVIGEIDIGDNVTIGANAVVTKSVPPDCVVVGVPARIIKRSGVRVDEAL